MNYEDMSSAEINRKLTELLHNPGEPHCIIHNGVWHKSIGHIIGSIPTGAFKFLNDERWWVPFPDYCNNPSDAWPIVIANNISINHGKTLVNDEWVDIWFVGAGIPEAQERTTNSSKVLRAAMICFLKMKDAENEK